MRTKAYIAVRPFWAMAIPELQAGFGVWCEANGIDRDGAPRDEPFTAGDLDALMAKYADEVPKPAG